MAHFFPLSRFISWPQEARARMRRFLIETVGKVGETMAVLKGLVNEEDGENGFSRKRMSFLIESKDYMKKNNTPGKSVLQCLHCCKDVGMGVWLTNEIDLTE